MASTLASTAHRRLADGLIPRAAAAVSTRLSFLCRNTARRHLDGRRALASAACAGTRPLTRAATTTPSPRPPQQGQRRPQSTAAATTTPSATPPFAFAFDIDGVLLHVNEPIPGAAEALRHLHRHNIPFILLTNGGGRYEADRVADLQQRLGFDLHGDAKDAKDAKDADCGGPLPVLSTANFVQSHTPFQELLDNATGLDRKAGGGAAASLKGLRDQTILVTGSDASRIRTIAEKYGFESVVTPADILAAYPAIFPFDPLLKSVYAETARPLPKPLLLEGGKLAASAAASAAPFSEDRLDASKYLRIAAAFVFNDPRDWALDIQLLTDLLQARRGFLGTFDPASLSARGTAPNDGARIFFSNADLLWSTTYHLPRFGQGAFSAATAGVWQQLAAPAQAPLLSPENGRATLLGKPNEATYLYAERTLTRYREALIKAHGGSPATAAPLKSVYMVGDNPASDIAGANQFSSTHGTDWCSVLVETGVYDPLRDGGSSDYLQHRPRVIVRDVAGAVRWALQREGWPADF